MVRDEERVVRWAVLRDFGDHLALIGGSANPEAEAGGQVLASDAHTEGLQAALGDWDDLADAVVAEHDCLGRVHSGDASSAPDSALVERNLIAGNLERHLERAAEHGDNGLVIDASDRRTVDA